MKKKLIEVALPLEAINREAAREKSIRHGHPSTLHLWWARRPLAACRAVLFASLVDDPSSHPEKFPTDQVQERERQRLFRIIEELVKWENSNNEVVLKAAREEILKSTGGHPPPVLDPFCGGGSIPLEAQRLGLEARASDLNPVAVLITKALIEIPPRFAGRPPVNPEARKKLDHSKGWKGATGLAEDVRYYGTWMRAEAEKRIGHLYPKVRLPKEHGGGEATVIAWLWARTVTCPNPACRAQMPLVRSFWLSTKKDKKAWVEPIVDRKAKRVRFEVKTGNGEAPDPPKTGRGANFRCLVCSQDADEDHIKAEGAAGRMASQMMAIVVEGQRARIYLPPSEAQVGAAERAVPTWRPDHKLPDNTRWFSPPVFGLDTFGDLFTPRQLVALTTFSDLVGGARERVLRDAVAAGLPDDGKPLHPGGTGATAYADAVATFLGFAVDRSADAWSSLTSWGQGVEATRGTFARQALPMVWDYTEANPFSDACGNWDGASIAWVVKAVAAAPATRTGVVKQLDATAAINGVSGPMVCTDPPYYDNIGYADLSDFFYVWLRRALRKIYPDLFSTVLVPKAQELVATPYRFEGDSEKARAFFEEGLGKAFARMREAHHPDYPLTVFYAFKQAEEDESDDDANGGAGESVASTGWETMLEGLLKAGFSIDGTWPMRTERGGRTISVGTNALASSVVLVCRPRPADAAITTRRDFVKGLSRELPEAIKVLQRQNIAPVDLAQACIGPGMAIFSRHAKVLEADGRPMAVRAALQEINRALDEVLAQQEGEFDPSTRWALAWFEQHALEDGPYGDAETLSKAKNTSVRGMEEAGIVKARGGKVRLLKRDELDAEWDPATDRRLTVWEAAQHLIRTLEKAGEAPAAGLLSRLGGLGESIRDLAYRLYTLCDRKRWAEEARAYNGLVVAWPRLVQLASSRGPEQAALGF